MKNKLRQNFIFAFIAQAISLIVSCCTNLILPKIISVVSFSYWQLFLFYDAYMPSLSLGLNDGIYLRYGGYRRSELDKNSIKSQFFVGMLFQILLGLLTGTVFIIFSNTFERKIVLGLVIIYFYIYTAQNFLGYIFQAINEVNIFSKSIIIIRIFFLAFQVLLIEMHIKNPYYYMVVYIISITVALIFLYYKLFPEMKEGIFNFKLGMRECLISMKIGISLMVANICSLLILGVSRQIIDMRWGLLEFGKISFSLTLMNFALTFIMQIGLVLFPALRRLSMTELKRTFWKLSKGLFYLLPVIYILYIPCQSILEIWLPNYKSSIQYLSILLPICYFDSKMNLIGNTFFKVLNKQVFLLKINIITIIISGACGIVSAYILNSMNFVIISMVVAIIFRSVFADMILGKIISVNINCLDTLDILLAVLFMVTINILVWWQSLIILVIMYLIRIILLRNYSPLRE